ncbi:unnamed protein product, partial [Allacma fusca]
TDKVRVKDLKDSTDKVKALRVNTDKDKALRVSMDKVKDKALKVPTGKDKASNRVTKVPILNPQALELQNRVMANDRMTPAVNRTYSLD